MLSYISNTLWGQHPTLKPSIIDEFFDPTKTVTLDKQEVVSEVLDELERRWLLPSGAGHAEALRHAYIVCGVNPDHPVCDNRRVYSEPERQLFFLYKATADDTDLRKRVVFLMDVYEAAREKLNQDESFHTLVTNPLVQVLRFLLSALHQKQYRRVGLDCYEQVYANGHATLAWQKACSIEEFVGRAVTKEQHMTLWVALTDRKTRRRTIKHLTTCTDREFPELKVSFDLRSFNNGVFNCRTLEFTPHPYPDASIASCKFYNVRFDPVWIDEVDFYNIPTPLLSACLDGMDEMTVRWFWAMLGRPLFQVNELDRWHAAPLFLGGPGSGKDQAMSVIRDFYADIHVASTNQKMGAIDHNNKRLLLFHDVEELDVPQFLAMVSGESTIIPIRFQNPIELRWVAPLVFGSCTPPKCVEDGCRSVSRRIVPFVFRGTKTEAVPNNEMGAIVCKASMAYRSAVQANGDKPIASILPPAIMANKKRVACYFNPIVAFLEQSGKIELGPNLNTSFKDMSEAVKQHCKITHTSMVPFTQDYYAAAFEERGIEEAYGDNVILSNGMLFRGRYFSGVGLQADCE